MKKQFSIFEYTTIDGMLDLSKNKFIQLQIDASNKAYSDKLNGKFEIPKIKELDILNSIQKEIIEAYNRTWDILDKENS